MAVNWTAEQRQVIESRGRSLLVSAAAGSGKTAVLVERIIRMLTDETNPVDVDRLLVMTFTRAAASEMRERIQAAIEKKLEEDPKNDHLQQQAVLVQFAQITTIDSFCLHILRENFDRLDVDPAFRVGEEGEMLLLRGEVMEELLEDYYRDGGEAFSRFVDTYAVGKADGGIDEYIYQVYTFAQSNPWPEEWLNRCRRELLEVSPAALEETPWMRFLLRDAAMQAEEWRWQLLKALDICREENGPEAYIPMLTEDLRHVEGILKAAGESFSAFGRALEETGFSRLAAIRGKNGEVDPEKKELAAEYRNRVKKAVEKMREEYLFESPEEVLNDMAAGRDELLMLLELAEEFSRRFLQKKREKNVVDFHDLEHFALEILTEEREEGTAGEEEAIWGRRCPGPVAEELSRQYDEILVDEYQDSNLVQETLIRCLSRERFGRPNVFMVGDVKQSIYKFRLARPELFLEKYHTYSREESSHQMIELHQNFRSRSHVLDSINDVFFGIMTRKLGGIEYTRETALHAGADFEPREGLSELDSELLLIDTSQDTLEELSDDTADYTSRELEAGMIAGKIRDMVAEESGISVWDKEQGAYRRAQYGDIVILLRSVSGWAETFVEVLSHQGIPALAESRTGYFNTIEVETILNLLAVIDNPIQDIPLASVLKSPFGGITDEELAHIAARQKGRLEQGRERGLYWAVLHFLEEEADGDLARRLRRILALLEEFREAAVYLSMHELLYRIYDRTGYYDFASAMPAGEVRRANLDMLVQKAAAYEATSYRGVFHFIKYIEKLKKYNTDFGEAAAASDQGNAVRIMSIHKSKGLEFPVVIVAGLGKQFNRQDVRGKLLIDGDLGIGTDYLDSERRLKGPTLKKNVMKRRMELEALGEELRVLYVALTRAKEKLILTASSRNLAERLEKWSHFSMRDGQVPCTVLTLASSYLDWILMSMRGGNVRITVREETAAGQLGREIEKQLFRRGALDELLAEREAEVWDEGLRERIRRSFSFVYPFAADLLLNTKMSVSELKKKAMEGEEKEEETAFLPSLPAFLEKREMGDGGAVRGTAYHRLMELLPFEEFTAISKASRGGKVRAVLRELVSSGKMTEEAAGLIWEKDIVSFLEGPLGQRMGKAAAAGRLKREQQFVMGIPAREMGQWDSDELVLIQGVIDAYFEEDGGLVLVDYKTDWVDSADTLKKRYREQLRYYERALEQITGKAVREKYIYSWRLGLIPM